MKKDSSNYIKDIVRVIDRLNKNYPNQHLSTHLSIAFSDYTKLDGITNKEFFYSLEKYECEKELDIVVPREEDIQKIIKDAENLNLDDFADEDF